MRVQLAIVVFAALTMPIKSQTLDEISQFAQSMCGEIPSGSLTRLNIKEKIGENKENLSKLTGKSSDNSSILTEEIYKGIPFDKLPKNIPTISMCKTELLKILAPVLLSVKMNDSTKNTLKLQNELLLQPIASTTPIEKIKSVYGIPSKVLPSSSKDGLKLSFYDGIGHKLLLLTKKGENTGKFGIFRESDSKNSIAVPYYGDDLFSKFSLGFVINECNSIKPSQADARYAYFLTSACDRGKPGGYQSYYFGFRPEYIDCKTDAFEWNGKKEFKALRCNSALFKTLPEFVFISPDESDINLAERVYSTLYWRDSYKF